MAMQPRLLDLTAPARAQKGILHRSTLDEAITWLEIHGDRPDVVAHWRGLQSQGGPSQPQEQAADAPYRARRRRRGRRRSPFVPPQRRVASIRRYRGSAMNRYPTPRTVSRCFGLARSFSM